MTATVSRRRVSQRLHGQRCEDGVVAEGLEACDDGNQDNTDACLTTCQLAACGDGSAQGLRP